MKRVTKSVTALLLALVLSLTLLPAQALAADTAPATQTYTGTAYVGAHTNPVYARVWKGVAETSLQTAPSAQTAVAAQAVDYLTETEAVAALRGGGATCAFLSGAGPTVLGIFEEKNGLNRGNVEVNAPRGWVKRVLDFDDAGVVIKGV